MTRAHFLRKATDNQGNVVPGTVVTVYEVSSLTVVPVPLYVNEVGSITKDNPFVINDGVVEFYLDEPRQVRIGLRSPAGPERFQDSLDVFPDPTTVVAAPAGLQITNIPLPGQFLQAVGMRQATWVDAAGLETAALSPVVALLQQDFSAQNLGELTLRTMAGMTATPLFTDVSADPKPPGFTFTKALDWATTEPFVLTAPADLFVEGGLVQFLYKVIAPAEADGATAVLRASIDDGTLWAQTPLRPETYGEWTLGYLANIPPGTHTVRFQHTPGTDSSRVLLGSVVIQYGGQVPAHDHDGAGLLSTAVGPDASANFSGATALGGNASVGGDSGTAVGSYSSAQASGTALGANTTAVESAVAVGYQARTSPSAARAVALGSNANAQAPDALAAGPNALATAAGAVAVGAGSLAALDAVALGHNATASGQSSVALGADAEATHARSAALGPGAQTTADDQLMLGTAEDTTVVSGRLDQRGDTVLGSSTSTLGFFGETGVQRPTVSGSRGGNTLLGALITHLANLGLITDETTP